MQKILKSVFKVHLLLYLHITALKRGVTKGSILTSTLSTLTQRSICKDHAGATHNPWGRMIFFSCLMFAKMQGWAAKRTFPRFYHLYVSVRILSFGPMWGTARQRCLLSRASRAEKCLLVLLAFFSALKLARLACLKSPVKTEQRQLPKLGSNTNKL